MAATPTKLKPPLHLPPPHHLPSLSRTPSLLHGRIRTSMAELPPPPLLDGLRAQSTTISELPLPITPPNTAHPPERASNTIGTPSMSGEILPQLRHPPPCYPRLPPFSALAPPSAVCIIPMAARLTVSLPLSQVLSLFLSMLSGNYLSSFCSVYIAYEHET